LVGRDPSAQIRFDSDQDDLVSRQHLKIARDVIEPDAFKVVDLESRNGCFLNKRRVFGSVRLSHGDVIELGMGGPKFRFELDPPPDVTGLPTRDLAAGTTEMSSLATSERHMPTEMGMSGSRPVGKATVERIIGEKFDRVQGSSRRLTWIIAGGLIVVAGVGYLTLSSVRQVSQEAADAQAATDARLKETNAEIAKNPAMIQSMRDEITLLREQIRQTEQRQGQDVKELTELVRQTGENQAKQAKLATQTAGEYATFKTRWDQLVREERYQEAYEVAQTLVTMNANRYEGYALSGIASYFLKDYTRACSYLKQGADRAPADQRKELANLVQKCEQEKTVTR
jgi:hypothetical protein